MDNLYSILAFLLGLFCFLNFLGRGIFKRGRGPFRHEEFIGLSDKAYRIVMLSLAIAFILFGIYSLVF
jgi:hypothetical protein